MFKDSFKKITAMFLHRMYCLALRNEGVPPQLVQWELIQSNSVQVKTLSWTLFPADNLVSALSTSKPAQCLQVLNNWTGLYISTWKFTERWLSPTYANVPSVHMLESFSTSLRHQSQASKVLEYSVSAWSWEHLLSTHNTPGPVLRALLVLKLIPATNL